MPDDRRKCKGVEVGEFKGKPTLTIPVGEPDDKGEYWPMTFGIGKAKAIIEHYDDIVAFVATPEEKF